MGVIYLLEKVKNDKFWLKNYNRIKEIVEESGNIPMNDIWVKKQLIYWKKNAISKEKKELLDYIGMDWYEMKFYQSILDDLKKYYEENNNLDIDENASLYFKYHQLKYIIKNHRDVYELIAKELDELEEKINGRKKTNIN